MVNSDSALYAICTVSTNNDALLNSVIKTVMSEEEKNKVNFENKHFMTNLVCGDPKATDGQ